MQGLNRAGGRHQSTASRPAGRVRPRLSAPASQGVRSEVLLHALEDKGIYVSSGSACSSNHPGVSGTLKGIGVKGELLDATLRFSFGMFNTEEEVDYCHRRCWESCFPCSADTGGLIARAENDKKEENMNTRSFLIKYAEIGIKGKNRYKFEDALIKQIRHALKGRGGRVCCNQGSRAASTPRPKVSFDFDEAVEALKRVFGIAGICPMVQIEDKGYEDLKEQVVKYIGPGVPGQALHLQGGRQHGATSSIP